MHIRRTTARRNKVRLLAVLCLVFLAFVGAVTLTNRLFAIHTIEIIGSQVDLTLDERSFTKNLLFFSTKKLRGDLLKRSIRVRDVVVTKKFPHTLIVEITLREPIALVTGAGRQVLVDGDGVVLGDALGNTSSLTEIFWDTDTFTAGQPIQDEALRQALAFLSLAKETLVVQTITPWDSQSLRANLGEVDIYFPQTGPLENKVATLQTLLDGFRIKGTLPKTIDLRFDKPVVTF